MIIQKILNNNVIVSTDENNHEIIVMGRGLAFGKKVGMEVDVDKVNKTFHLTSDSDAKHAIDILSIIPEEILALSDEVVHYGKTVVGKPLNDIVYIAISDHIYSTIERYKEGVKLKNALLWDIRQFYKDEYRIGVFARDLIEERLGVDLLEDEAGFIALHFVNAQMDEAVDSAMQLTEIMQEVTNIVKYYFQVDLDEESFHFYRYINHLKSFGQRLLNRTIFESDEDPELLALIQRKYQNAYNCALDVAEFIRNKYTYVVSNEEIIYLTIHIHRLIYVKEGGR